MSDRTVRAILKADVGSFVASMRTAQKATTDFAAKASKSAEANKKQWETLGRTSMVAGGVMAAGVGLAVKTFADFDAAMSQAQAGTMATGASLAALRAAAVDAGAKTQFSATEAANAITEMGKAGVSTKDILGGGLNGALALAAAGQLDVGKASEIAATSMNQFGLSGKDIPHIADLLAAGAGKAMGSVEDLSGALKYAGVVTASAGWSIEETTGVLAEFAQAGIKGEQAGTSLRGILSALTAPSAKAAGAMQDLGLNMYDSNGHMLKAAPLAGALQKALGGLSEADRNAALGQIFGNEQLTAAQVLYKGGAGAVTEWTKGVNDAGYATRQAAMLTDNWKGDLERLGGSLSSVLIESGSGANSALRGMTQGLQGVVDGFGSLPTPLQQSALGLTGVAAAGLLTVGAVGTMVPKFKEFKGALDTVGISSGRTGSALKGLGKAAGIAGVLYGVGTAIATISNATGTAVKGIETTTEALIKSGDTVKNVNVLFHDLDSSSSPVNDLATAFKRLTDKSWVDTISDGGDALIGMSNGGTKAAETFTKIGQSLGQLVSSGQAPAAKAEFDAMAKKLNLTGAETEKLMALMPAYGEAIAGAGNQTALAGGKTKGLTGAVGDIKPTAEDARKALDDLKAAVEGYGNVTLDARGSTRDYQAALDDATAALKANGRTHDDNSAKGRANNAVLDALSKTALKSATANFENGRSVKSVTADVVKARAQFITFAERMGYSKTQANRLATQLGLTATNVTRLKNETNKVPAKKSTTYTTPGLKKSHDDTKAFMDLISNAQGKNINVGVKFGNPFGNNQGIPGTAHNSTKFAGGGGIRGAGTGTSDSIPIMASDGEHMWTAKEVSAAGGHGAVEAMRAGVLRGFATGGSVFREHVNAPSRKAGQDYFGGGLQAFANAHSQSILAALGGGGSGGGAAGGAGGAARWASTVLQALAMLGQSPSNLGAVLRLINKESGGNPNAVNNWDSNAKAGHPSGGLIQTIIGTFMANAGPLKGLGMFNPLANIYAGLHYAIGRYGSIAAVDPLRHAGGYAAGTTNARPGLAMVGERGPELLRFAGGEQVVPNNRLVGFASGGQVDIAAILDAMHSGEVTRDDLNQANTTRATAKAAVATAKAQLAALLASRAKVYRGTADAQAGVHKRGMTTAQRHAAENRLADALDRQRKLLGQIASAEGKVTTSRVTLTKATTAAAKAAKAYASPLITQFGTAITSRNKISATFLKNLTTLTGMGLTTLAKTLLAQGDPEAEKLAAQAVKLPLGKAKALEAGLKASAATDAGLQKLQDKLNGLDQVVQKVIKVGPAITASYKAMPPGWVRTAAAAPALASTAAQYSLGQGNQFYSYDPSDIVAEQRKRAADAAALYNIGV